MKRVLLLVCLIVSLVELDWERDRIYLLSSTASLLLVLYSELMGRRKVQRVATARALKTGESDRSDSYVPDSLARDCRADNVEKVVPTSAAIQEVVLMQNNSG